MALTKVSPNILSSITSDKLPSGSVLQVVNAMYRDSVTYANTALNTWPVSATLTPKYVTSKIMIIFNGWIQPNSEMYGQVYLYCNGSRVTTLSNINSTGASQGAFVGGVIGLSTGADNASNQGRAISFNGMDTPATTSQLTYDLRCQTGNATYCSYSLGKNASSWSQTGIQSLTLMEIAG